MLEGFIRHIREKNVLDIQGQYLLAISGGMDSTVLAHLLDRAGISFCMAHCNFMLRGEESDGDERFVRSLGKQLTRQVHVKTFDTRVYAAEKGISTQMAARELRYNWFGELLEKGDLKGLIVAHHADDQIETVLLNLLRGTGIEGLYGMSGNREKIIRPLLPFPRAMLEDFAASEGIAWREDRSNASIDYKRNFIRHRIVPQLKEFDPAALSLLQYSFDRVKDTGKAFFYLYQHWIEKYVREEGAFQYLELAALEKASGKKSLLFYWLRPFGYSFQQLDDVLAALEKKEAGKVFFSAAYALNLDREHLILGPSPEEFEEKWIEASAIGLVTGEDAYDLLVLDPPASPPTSSAEAMLDRDKLNFPLRVRSWQQGDRFRPLGMKNFKKVSDVLIDMKLPLIHKKNIKVVCSGEDIVWVIGVRIDDRYKITPVTRSVLYFKKKKSEPQK